MQSSKFNFATVISIIVLLIFSYITFLGLVYWQNGDFTIAATLTVIFFTLGVISIYFLTSSAESRWGNIRLWGQIGFGSATFILLIVASFPFTNFLRVSSDAEILGNKIVEIRNTAISMDSAYSQYVSNRVESYRLALNNIAKTNPAQSKSYIDGAYGATNDEKIKSVVTSLENRLLPKKSADLIKSRQEWLIESCKVNPWNPKTPTNLNTIGQEVMSWKQDYETISKFAYNGEPAEVENGFVFNDFKINLENLNEEYSSFGTPNAISIICALICFGFIMLPFFTKKKDRAGIKREDDGNLFNKRDIY